MNSQCVTRKPILYTTNRYSTLLVDNPLASDARCFITTYVFIFMAFEPSPSRSTLLYSYLLCCIRVFVLVLAFIQHNPRFPFLFVQLLVHPLVVADGHLLLLSRVTDGGGWVEDFRANECLRMRNSFSEHWLTQSDYKNYPKSSQRNFKPKLIKPKIIQKTTTKNYPITVKKIYVFRYGAFACLFIVAES